MSDNSSEINLIWKITDLERELLDGYVFRVYWELTPDFEGTGSSFSGSLELQRPDDLISYENLTEELVVSWVKSSLGEDEVNKLEMNLRNHIQNQNIEPKNSNGLPWSTPVVEETP
jgi:hypothetical protein